MSVSNISRVSFFFQKNSSFHMLLLFCLDVGSKDSASLLCVGKIVTNSIISVKLIKCNENEKV